MREDNAMINMTLSVPERQQLEATFTTTADRRLRNRYQAMLMAARQRRQPIAEDLGRSPRTLQHWLNAYRYGGLDALIIR
jgi:hypothetical protein